MTDGVHSRVLAAQLPAQAQGAQQTRGAEQADPVADLVACKAEALKLFPEAVATIDAALDSISSRIGRPRGWRPKRFWA